MSVRRTDFCEVWAWVFGDNSLGFVFTCVLLCLLGLKSNHRRLFSACLSRNTCFKKKKREKKNHSLKKSLVFRESQETSSVLIEMAAQEQLQKSCNKDCLIMFFWRSRWGPAQTGMELLAVGLPSVAIGFWPRSLWVPRPRWHCPGRDLCLWQRGVSMGYVWRQGLETVNLFMGRLLKPSFCLILPFSLFSASVWCCLPYHVQHLLHVTTYPGLQPPGAAHQHWHADLRSTIVYVSSKGLGKPQHCFIGHSLSFVGAWNNPSGITWAGWCTCPVMVTR